MRWLRWYTVLMVVLLGMYMYAMYKKPVPLNWKKTFSNRDKIPYGGYIAYRELQVFTGLAPEELRVPVYEQVNNSSDSNDIYILVGEELPTTTSEEAELLRYVAKGNTVFISAESLHKSLEDSLGLNLENYYFGDINGDSTRINFTNPSLESPRPYTSVNHTIDGYFKSFDTARTTVLGRNNHGKVNFIRMDIGKGKLFLHAVPVAFTNYFILESNNSDYTGKMLSYLPGHADKLFWDEYYKQGRGGSSSPLRVILTRPELRWAYVTALATMLIFMLFQSKRRQRAIPVITAPENTTVEFVDTVSQVYFSQRNHRNIALKKLTYLFEHIRTRFNLNTSLIDDEFREKLMYKSGMPEDELNNLVSMIRFVRTQEKISDQHLIRLNALIEEFHKYSPR